jgi:short-subunit dehydrogenase
LVLLGRRTAAGLDPDLFTAANYCRVDLAQPYAVELVVAFLRQQQIQTIDCLIHNAALGWYGVPSDQSPESIETLLAVNLRAPIALTHTLIPWLKTANGRVVFISSVAAAAPAPNYAVYAASKAALDGFARSLRVELGASIGVQVIHPGATRTNMHARSGVPLQQIGWQRFPSAARTATQIMAAIDQQRPEATIGWVNRGLRWAGRWLSTAVDAAAARRIAPLAVVRPAQSGQQHCVITGAADGIGRALALRYAAAGYMVTGIDYDRERAARTHAEITALGGVAQFLHADLASAASLTDLIADLCTQPPVDLLVHSAGINAVGRFGQLGLEAQQRVLSVNLVAPVVLTSQLLAAERIAQQATLVFIASLSCFTGYPGAATYAASKDGLAAYARNLRIALQPSHVRVLTVYPGPTRTAHARRYSPDNRREARRMPPETLAQLIKHAVQRGQRHLIPGLGNQAFALAGQLRPSLTEQILRRGIYERLGNTE